MPLHPGGLVSVEIPTIIVTVDYNGFENWIDWVVATSVLPIAAQIKAVVMFSLSQVFWDTTYLGIVSCIYLVVLAMLYLLMAA